MREFATQTQDFVCSIFDGILDNSYWQISTNKVILGGKELYSAMNQQNKKRSSKVPKVPESSLNEDASQAPVFNR